MTIQGGTVFVSGLSPGHKNRPSCLARKKKRKRNMEPGKRKKEIWNPEKEIWIVSLKENI